ncbi:MAG TPA: medium chain dehydrogenase/reductase family protein [Acidobacteriaceae bacterium]|jgi:NADPH:quinone reductase-like Zn-dependent oxidoreductase
MTKFRKVVITEFGDEGKLAIVESDLPDPSAGEVQVTVAYSIVAGADVNMRRGTYPFQKKPPLTPGYSILGTVRLNGQGCSKFRVGDRVACLTKYDGQAELINLPERFLVLVPEGAEPKAAVALVLDWVTAYEMLHRSTHVHAGQRLFVHGLSGAVGAALLILGKLAGAEVLGTASAAKHDELRKAGATAFDYRNKKWITDVQSLGGVDVVFDPLGYESFDESWSILRRGGTVVGYGMNLPGLSGTPYRAQFPSILKLMGRNLLFWTGKRATFFGLTRTSKNYAPDLELLLEWLAAGKITVPIKAVFPLDQIREAHREYAKSSGVGSIILDMRR